MQPDDSRLICLVNATFGETAALPLALSDRRAAVAPIAAQPSVSMAEQTTELSRFIMMIKGMDGPIVLFAGDNVKLFEFSRSRGEILSTAETIDSFDRTMAVPSR